jgi:hypothetical protein
MTTRIIAAIVGAVLLLLFAFATFVGMVAH